MKIKLKYSHWLPKLLGVNAITLYPYVLFSLPVENTRCLTLLHELVHVRQVRQMGWLKFYGSYLWLYLKGRFKGLGHEEAYRTHPYEEEAYSTAGSLIPTSEELIELGEDAGAH